MLNFKVLKYWKIFYCQIFANFTIDLTLATITEVTFDFHCEAPGEIFSRNKKWIIIKENGDTVDEVSDIQTHFFSNIDS